MDETNFPESVATVDADGPEGAPARCAHDPAAWLSPRVGYERAAEMLCVSLPQLRALIRNGDLPVIQPQTGRRGALIEVRALQDLMDRWRAQAQREATTRAKSVAARGGAQ